MAVVMMTTRKRIDPETKQRALMLARNVGAAEAARRTGIRENTICVWLHRAGEVDATQEARQRMSKAQSLTQEQKRQELAGDLMRLARGFAKSIVIPDEQSVSDLDDVKVMTVALGITVDKLQRMMGDAGVDEDQVIEIDLGKVRRPTESAVAG